MSGNLPPYLADFAAEDSDVRDAIDFHHSHHPQAGVEYSWILTEAKASFANYDATFNDLDAKATTILVYLGSGAGLLTVGLLVPLSSGTVSLSVATATIPALVLAAVSLGFAVKARKPVPLPAHPRVVDAAAAASKYPTACEAQGSLLGQWAICTAGMRVVVRRKSESVRQANRFLFWAVVLLALPLLVCMGMKWIDRL